MPDQVRHDKYFPDNNVIPDYTCSIALNNYFGGMGAGSSKKTILWIIFASFLSIVSFVAVTSYMTFLTLRHNFGMPVTGSIAGKIFDKQFQWQTDLPGYTLQGGEFSITESPCKTETYHFRTLSAESKKEVLIISHLVELEYYKPDKIEIKKELLEKSFTKATAKYPDLGITRSAIFPLTLFNTRLFPTGEYLQISGIDTIYCVDKVLGSWKAKIIFGNFQELGFEVLPNNGTIRNIPETIGFEGEKCGTLILLQSNTDKKYMMIHYVENATVDEYVPSLTKLLSKIPSLILQQ
jgi:hypothetical protein